TSGGCDLPCPDGFTEGVNGCLVLQTKNGSYSNSLGHCQLLENGDLLAYQDFQHEFEAVSSIMKSISLPNYLFYVNGFASDLV
ncbi:hypothetical protein PFISCL1PPCAC_6453, partial [Pristionchus fissidentatus]